jgi:formamidopyrimidine-DNA glycosylase
MPELPEVEVSRRGLVPHLPGCRVSAVRLSGLPLRQPLPQGLAEQLCGRTLRSIGRRSKYLLFDFDSESGGGWLIVHLGMTGSLRLLPLTQPVGKHDHADIDFVAADGRGIRLRYCDPRRFGLLGWHQGGAVENSPLLAGLGIEPLGEAPLFDGDWLYRHTRGRSAPIKQVLMDGGLVVGVGNIYAAESLFAAGISPKTAASRLGLVRCRRLAEAVKTTLSAAIEAGGSTIRDFIHTEGMGYFQLQAGVYGRAGEVCRRCGGTICQIRQGGRSTFYCPGCQK